LVGGGASFEATASKRVAMVRVVRGAERSAPTLTVVVGAARVEVGEGFDRGLLRAVVCALGDAS
jgi:hypothetical protein